MVAIKKRGIRKLIPRLELRLSKRYDGRRLVLPLVAVYREIRGKLAKRYLFTCSSQVFRRRSRSGLPVKLSPYDWAEFVSCPPDPLDGVQTREAVLQYIYRAVAAEKNK